MQWWILGEANEAVASDPLENSTYNFISLQMFFRNHYKSRDEKWEIQDRFEVCLLKFCGVKLHSKFICKRFAWAFLLLLKCQLNL